MDEWQKSKPLMVDLNFLMKSKSLSKSVKFWQEYTFFSKRSVCIIALAFVNWFATNG